MRHLISSFVNCCENEQFVFLGLFVFISRHSPVTTIKTTFVPTFRGASIKTSAGVASLLNLNLHISFKFRFHCYHGMLNGCASIAEIYSSTQDEKQFFAWTFRCLLLSAPTMPLHHLDGGRNLFRVSFQIRSENLNERRNFRRKGGRSKQRNEKFPYSSQFIRFRELFLARLSAPMRGQMRSEKLPRQRQLNFCVCRRANNKSNSFAAKTSSSPLKAALNGEIYVFIVRQPENGLLDQHVRCV